MASSAQCGKAGDGTNADRGATTITVDPDDKNAKDQDGKNIGPIVIAQSLAHETGHALFDNSSTIDPETSTRGAYVNEKVQRDLENEGEATFMNIEVQRESLIHGKVPLVLEAATDRSPAQEATGRSAQPTGK